MSKEKRIEKLEAQVRNLQGSLITTGLLKEGFSDGGFVRPFIMIGQFTEAFNALLTYLKLKTASQPGKPATPDELIIVKDKK